MRRVDLSIGQRLALGFGLVLAINALLLVGMQRWHDVSADAQRAYAEGAEPLRAEAQRLEQAVMAVALSVRDYMLAPNTGNRRDFDAAVATVRSRIAAMQRLPAVSGSRAEVDDIASRVETYLERAHRQVAEPGSPASIQLLVTNRVEVLRRVNEFVELQERNARTSLLTMAAAQQRATEQVWIATITSAVALLLIAVIIGRSVSRPVSSLVSVADAMQRGDWHPALQLHRPPDGTRSRDELTHLRAAFAAAASSIERREQRLTASRAIASAASAGLSKDVIGRAALEAIVDHVEAGIGVVYRLSRDGEMLIPVASHGLTDPAGTVDARDDRFARVIAERETIIIDGADASRVIEGLHGAASPAVRSVAIVPFVCRDVVLGVMVLTSPAEFDADASAFLHTSGSQLAIGFQNVRSFEAIQGLLADVEAKSAELQAQNEEIQAQNEEIQAQNEELQAQGEEIQSQNEALQAQAEEIRAQNEELTEQAAMLRAQSAELMHSDRKKNEFIGVLAHELRNPMAALSNNLHILRHLGTSGNDPRVLDAMERQTRQLTRLMDDLLDITRVSHGKITLQRAPLDLAELTRECVDDQRAVAHAAGITFQVGTPRAPVMIDGDRSRVWQVLCNLIDNSIKASARGGVIDVVLEIDPSSARARVRISDQGVGIDAEHLPALFRPFVQGHAPSHRRSDGLGLGLALVKSLVELHGGSVSVASDGAGRGATFEVEFPLLTDTGAAENHDDRPASRQAAVVPRRIVIVEDNRDAAQSLREALELSGHSVRVAYTAADGLDVVQSDPPDVVLCDIGLPDRDGYDVARECRATSHLAGTMLVALSGFATPVDVDRAKSAGFHHHLAKPVAIDRLNALIAS